MQSFPLKLADGNGGGGGLGGGEDGAVEIGVGVFGDETAGKSFVALMT